MLGITEYVSRNQGFSAKMCRDNISEDIEVKPVQCVSGGLKANFLDERKVQYNIALRNVIGDQCHIEMCLKSLKDFGFINYYERHKFGHSVNNHLIGKELLLKHWQEAIDLILEEWVMTRKPDSPKNVIMACFEYTSSRDVIKAMGMIDKRNMNSLPAKLLSSIKVHGDNLAEPLKTVPINLRQSYVDAYQCFIWNKIVSKRIAKFGSKVIVGDLVFPKGNNGQHNQREVIFIDDGNIRKYKIYDVVLPLPGPDTIYPANEIAGWYDDLFKADGLSEKDFHLKSKTYDFNGGYRPMLLRPSYLKWKFVRYDYPRQKLFLSKLDQRLGHPPVGSLPGAYLGLVLKFNLPAFGSFSMALREILKIDLNEATMKNQPVSEINSSVLDCPCPSPLMKIKLDSSEELQKNRNVAESSLSNPIPQLSVNECLDESQTKCVKEEPGIRRTRSSTLIESCIEEPAKKKFNCLDFLNI